MVLYHIGMLSHPMSLNTASISVLVLSLLILPFSGKSSGSGLQLACLNRWNKMFDLYLTCLPRTFMLLFLNSS